jgi:hypothetical protein
MPRSGASGNEGGSGNEGWSLGTLQPSTQWTVHGFLHLRGPSKPPSPPPQTRHHGAPRHAPVSHYESLCLPSSKAQGLDGAPQVPGQSRGWAPGRHLPKHTPAKKNHQRKKAANWRGGCALGLGESQRPHPSTHATAARRSAPWSRLPLPDDMEHGGLEHEPAGGCTGPDPGTRSAPGAQDAAAGEDGRALHWHTDWRRWDRSTPSHHGVAVMIWVAVTVGSVTVGSAMM